MTSFTYPTIILVPLLLRIFYHKQASNIGSFIKLINVLTVSFIWIIMISSYIFKFQHKSIAVMSWLTNILIFSFIKLPWSETLLSSSNISKQVERDSQLTLNPPSVFVFFRPKTEDLRSLIINVISSIIAFLIIYYLLGYR